jgi:hypothetical protein
MGLVIVTILVVAGRKGVAGGIGYLAGLDFGAVVVGLFPAIFVALVVE